MNYFRIQRRRSIDMAKKEVVSIRVSSEFKKNLEAEAQDQNMSVSEYILDTLDSYVKTKEEYKEATKELEQKLDGISENKEQEKKALIEDYEEKLQNLREKIDDSVQEKNKLFKMLETEKDASLEQQKLLSQQQQLQLFTQKQVEDLQQKQLLIENEETKKSWWRFWSK